MSAGYSGTPLAKKLGIAPGTMVAVLDRAAGRGRRLPEELASTLDPSVRIRTDLRARGPYDVVIVFVRSEAELSRRFEQARARLDQAGGLWVAWPKQSSPLATDLRESHVRTHGLSTGLVDNKVCAIDADWSGLRFVVRRRDRTG